MTGGVCVLGVGCGCLVARSLFCGCCGHLWPFVFVGIVVCGHYGQLSPFAVWAVIVAHHVS